MTTTPDTTSTPTEKPADNATGRDGREPGTTANGNSPLVDRLGEPATTVLRVAMESLDATSDVLAKCTSETERINTTVDMLAAKKTLRLLTLAKTKTLPEGDDKVTEHVNDLLTGDEQARSAAAAGLRVRVATCVAQARSERRSAKRSARPDAASKAETYQEARLKKVTEQRDRAEGRNRHLEEQNDSLREQVAALQEAAADATRSIDSAARQIAQLRERSKDITWLAGLLLDEISRLERVDSETHHAAASGAGPLDQVDAALAQTGIATAFTHRRTDETASQLADGLAVESLTGAFTDPNIRRGLLTSMLRALAVPPILTRDLGLRIDVLGAGEEIGGSCVLVTAGSTRILVDCGARPNAGTAEDRAPRDYAKALAGRVDAVIITHAHNDHAGWVPALLRERPDTPIFATPATCDLLAVMWVDSAKVLQRQGVIDAYTQGDVNRSLEMLNETPFRHELRIKDLTIELFPAGHIVGAASVVVTAGEQRVVVSGDVSASGQETVGGFQHIASAQGADLLLLESTYAADYHRHSRRKVVGDFIRQVEATVAGGGLALVPAFALGRAQEIALILAKHLPEVPVLVDGLARDVTNVYERHPGPDGKTRRIFTGNVNRVDAGGTNRAIRDFRSGVVISTSGMLNQGPAVAWARRVLPDPKSSLMVVGYQDADSPGGKLVRLAEAGGGSFDLPAATVGGEPQPVAVHANVGQYQLGAHANADDLARIAAQLQAKQLMLVHGEPSGQARFASRMTQRAQKTVRAGTWAH